jgi:hypothetical protein
MRGDARDRAIAAALARRLEEVRRLLPRAFAVDATPQPPVDPEEQLRIVMVRLWPKASAEGSDADAWERLAEGVLSLALPAAGEDWRFLDSWNNAYETLAVGPQYLELPSAQRFLATYADLLHAHVQRLA